MSARGQGNKLKESFFVKDGLLKTGFFSLAPNEARCSTLSSFSLCLSLSLSLSLSLPVYKHKHIHIHLHLHVHVHMQVHVHVHEFVHA